MDYKEYTKKQRRDIKIPEKLLTIRATILQKLPLEISGRELYPQEKELL